VSDYLSDKSRMGKGMGGSTRDRGEKRLAQERIETPWHLKKKNKLSPPKAIATKQGPRKVCFPRVGGGVRAQGEWGPALAVEKDSSRAGL